MNQSYYYITSYSSGARFFPKKNLKYFEKCPEGTLGGDRCELRWPSFSPQALNGDLWAQKFQHYGFPIKAIEETSDVDHQAKEVLTLIKSNQENVWKWCEEALEIRFDV
jgi:hypothetical protein